MSSTVLSGRAFQRDPLGFLQRLDSDREVLPFRAGLAEFTLIRSAELIERILVADNDKYGEGKWTQRGRFVMRDCLITREGGAHRERRAVIQPSFGRLRLAASAPKMVERALQVSEQWREGEVRDIYREMARIALLVVGDALFATDLAPETDEVLDALAAALRAIPRLPWPGRRFLAARRVLVRTARRLMQGDMVERLRKAGAGEDAIVNEIVSMLIAGVDTTPKTLAWTFFLLGRNPEAAGRVQAELSEVLGGRAPTLDDLPRLEYLHRVFDETMRLYPPVHFIDRRPLETVKLNGSRLGAGDYILLSPLVTHRDPRYFSEPSLFRPDRWLPEEAEKRPRFSFFPFGAGPHACIGEGLATMEVGLVAAALAQRWRFSPTDEMPAEPSPQTTRLPMKLERRG